MPPLSYFESGGAAMRSRVVAVRCFAEQNAGLWEAHCVELGLTVQGESLDVVKSELDRLVHELIDDTVIRRRTDRAPQPGRGALELRLRYWGLRLAGRLGLRADALQGTRPGARRYEARAVPRPLR